jgi:hypothetical protein
MSIYKRVAGNLVIQTVGATDTVTFEGLTANTATVIIDGDLTVSGNASLTGNISGDKIFNGTTSIEIPVASGNALISVNGTSNVLVVRSSGANITGTANITGAVSTGSTVSATGNITGANLLTAGNVWISRNSGTAQPTIRFNDTDTDTVDGQVFGAVEWFTADTTPGARVTAAVRAVASGVLGNANVQILTSTNGAAPTAKVTVDNVGNVGIANTAPVHTLAVSGTMYGSSTMTVVGNVTGGNLLTAGSATATGNIVAGNIATAGLITATGNIAGGNVISLGLVSAGAAGVTATGNVRGGNIVSDAAVSATGNITGSNLFTQGVVSATGNVTGNNASFGGNATVTQTTTTANLVVTNSSSGTGVGVENIVWQNTDFTIDSAVMANVGVLTFTALENQAYKFEAYMPVIPDGSTTTAFAVLFDNGACNYTVETQNTTTAAWATATSSTSDTTGTTQSMTGTTVRTVRITGTFAHTGNTAVTIRAQTSAANLVLKTGAHLTYTRIG